MLKIDVVASDAAGAVNEDVAGFCANAAWVIDGATGVGAKLLDAPSDAAWLAHRADRELRAALTTEPGLPTVDLMRRVMTACRDAVDTERIRVSDGPHDGPSAAFAMVRQIGQHIELSTLGDCRIAYDGGGDPRLFGTTALSGIEDRTIEQARRHLAREPGISPASLRELLMPQLQANRLLMNQPGGYWILGIDPEAADHLDQLVIPTRDGDVFALASDGFLRLIELFAVAGPADLLAVDEHDRFSALLCRLRDLERAEQSCLRYPRVKVHDDATFLRCRVVEEA